MKRIFEGLKIVDFSWALAGPQIAKYFVAYGATVIKIESSMRPDLMRMMSPYKDNKAGLNRAAIFNSTNTGKLDICINLKLPKALDVVNRIVAVSDIVIENWTPGTADELGLGYQNLKKVKPDIIMLSSSMFGQTGPISRHLGTGIPLTSLCGFTEITGWPDRPPISPFSAYTDFIAPRFASLCLIAALDYRCRTGKGQHLDISQFEASLHFLAPILLDYTANGRINTRIGNRCEFASPHGVYRCQGDDRWCAIAVYTDEEWQALCNVIGNPSWTKDEKLSTLQGRIENSVELDQNIESWTSQKRVEDVMKQLQDAGVGAGMVANGEDLHADPQLEYYHYYCESNHSEVGRALYHGEAVHLSKTPYEIGAPPCLGEHTEYVCKNIIGMSDDEFVTLIADGVFT